MTEMRGPYRDDLCREAKFTLVRAEPDSDGDGLTIEGYGAVFDQVTQIDSWEGSFEEVIERGAFRKSLRERTPKMQFDHGYHPLVGSIPIGRWDTAEEDARGLHVVGRLSDNWLVQPVRDAIADGGIDGMSFRFSVVREVWRDKDGKLIKPEELFKLLWDPGDRGPLRRTLKEVKTSEVGPVVWPAYEKTTVGVRDRGTVTIDLGRLHDPEQRKTLARAVLLADRAASTSDPTSSTSSTSSSRTSDEPTAEGQPSEPQPQPPSTPLDAPRPTAQPPADHPSDPGSHPASDAPASSEPQAGEHPSARTRVDHALRWMRGELVDMERKERLHGGRPNPHPLPGHQPGQGDHRRARAAQ